MCCVIKFTSMTICQGGVKDKLDDNPDVCAEKNREWGSVEANITMPLM